MTREELFVHCVAGGAMVSSVVAGVAMMKLLPLAADGSYLYEDVAVMCLLLWFVSFVLSTNWLFRWAIRFDRYMSDVGQGIKEVRGGMRKIAFFARGKRQKPIRVNKKGGRSVG